MTESKQKQVILISLDALGCTDFEDAIQLPHFRRLVEQGAYCSHELSVYPSLTFPSHASIATGCRPARHGIVSNYLLEPYSPVKLWNFYATNMNCRALWDYAADGGKTVLSMSWPVSAGANIRYSMPEMTPAKPKVWNAASFFDQLGVLRRYGTPGFAVRTLLSSPRLPKAWFFGAQPTLDQEMIAAFLRTIHKTPDFDIALLHIYGMDDAKHVHGANSIQARAYLSLYNEFIGKLFDYIEGNPQRDITLMITGDHAQKDVRQTLYGNHLLEKLGLCRFQDGKLADYKAYFECGDGMAYIRVEPPHNTPETVAAIEEAFRQSPGVARVISPAEAARLGCDSTAALVIEAADGYGFIGAACPGGMDNNCIGPSPDKGLHGYLPDGPDFQTMFFCYGQSVRPQEIDSMCITDITPTICQWLELPADPMDGAPLPGLFKKEGRYCWSCNFWAPPPPRATPPFSASATPARLPPPQAARRCAPAARPWSTAIFCWTWAPTCTCTSCCMGLI